MSIKSFHFEDLANGWRIGKFGAFEAMPWLRQAVTTRLGPGIPADLQAMAPAVQRLSQALSFPLVAYCPQVHGSEVLCVSAPGLAAGGDGLVTDCVGIGLLGRSADCPLILVADAHRRAIGMAHASWRGTVRRIASKLVSALV